MHPHTLLYHTEILILTRSCLQPMPGARNFLRVSNSIKARRSPDLKLKIASRGRTHSDPDWALLSVRFLMACLLQEPKLANRLTYDDSVVAKFVDFTQWLPQ